MNNLKISVLITSCDKFSDTWSIVSESFTRNWELFDVPIFLMSNHKEFENDLIISLKVGEDVSWSHNLVQALKSIDSEYIYIWLDDVFLASKVNHDNFGFILDFLDKYEPNYLRLRSKPSTSRFSLDKNFGYISKKSLFYRTSIFNSIWKREVLLDLLKETENAWEFETKGANRSIKYDKFYCVRRDFISYIHGIEKGEWNPYSLKKLKSLGYFIDATERKEFGKQNNLRLLSSPIKSIIFELCPPEYRLSLLQLFQKIKIFLTFRRPL